MIIVIIEKKKKKTVFFRNYKKFDNSALREALNRELIKYDLSNIEYDTFQEIIVSLLNVYATLKKKHLRANHASFVTKELRKAIMERTRLRNIYLKQCTETTKVAYNQQRNKCDIEVAKTFQNFFSSIVKNLNVKRDETRLSKATQGNPVLACIEKFSKHPSTVSIKKRMEINSNKFSFKYEERK